MKGFGYLWYFSMAIFLLAISCREQPTRPTLNIAVAANLQYAMEALVQDFTQSTGVPCEVVVSSSGKLTAQITEGAPFHLLVSADMKYPGELYQNGMTGGPPEVYAYGKLVLWTLQDNPVPSPELLKSDAVRHIAMANPKTAPYGRAAMEVLNNLGWYEQVSEKLVYGESISQTNQFITSKSAQIGFTAKSVVLSPEMKGKGSWIELNPSSYTPIAQGVIIVKQDQAEEISARKFYSYLFSAQAKKILKNFGYSVK